jgi:hypothetical protein
MNLSSGQDAKKDPAEQDKDSDHLLRSVNLELLH